MSLHRTIVVALATFITLGMTSFASAGCCGWGGYGAYGGEYGWGTAYGPPVVTAAAYSQPYGYWGSPTAAIVYAQPVAPAPIVVGGWGGGWGAGCACNRGLFTAGPSPLYVVNQGPYFSGPGLTVPYGTYAPQEAYAPANNYPYVGGGYGYRRPYYARPYYGHPYYGAHVGYHRPMYAHPHFVAGPHYYYHPHAH
jgi:hypothetical protein